MQFWVSMKTTKNSVRICSDFRFRVSGFNEDYQKSPPQICLFYFFGLKPRKPGVSASQSAYHFEGHLQIRSASAADLARDRWTCFLQMGCEKSLCICHSRSFNHRQDVRDHCTLRHRRRLRSVSLSREPS